MICAPEDIDRITAALAGAFTTGPARAYPTRDRTRIRLYLTATDRAPTPTQRLAQSDH
ncbi:hypothetical protein [Streptomyces lucensis]|uniref:hypothetical protein n=1 Tax=Streptomyces lucensis TaxID=67319 RepID=UPI001E3EFF54|nr:hypothetical protein [Streptomyces lucensis]